MALGWVEHACAQVFINEIFFDPGGEGSDLRDEYIEIRGPNGLSLENHYLLIIENELDEFGVGDAGIVENLFDLGIADNGQAASLGGNGFLLLRQKFSRYTTNQLSPLATDLVNDGPNLPGPALPGFGNDEAEGSTIGASDLSSTGGSASTGALENSGFTAMLIRNDSGEAPELGMDLDDGNDGLDNANGADGWTMLDSVGVFSEADETEFGRLYGRANFGSQDPGFPFVDFTPNVEPGADFELLDYEIEYIGRWGNSTGFTTADWHASNLTDNPGSGSLFTSDVNNPDFRQAGDPHPANDSNDTTPAPQPAFIESNKGVPYGTKLTDTLGAPNYLTGDYNGDGYVDAADYTVWRDTIGDNVGSEANHPAADANHDFNVDEVDYALWRASYGAPNMLASPASLIKSVPEPSAGVWLVFGFGILGVKHRRRAAGVR